MAIKNMLNKIAQHLSESVPGARMSKFTKHFERGVQPVGVPTVTDLSGKPLRAEDCVKYDMFVPSDGKPGGGSRVTKFFPLLPEWLIHSELCVFDPKIDQERLHRYLSEAGKFIGLGAFRPENRGYHGRFKVKEFNVREEAD